METEETNSRDVFYYSCTSASRNSSLSNISLTSAVEDDSGEIGEIGDEEAATDMAGIDPSTPAFLTCRQPAADTTTYPTPEAVLVDAASRAPVIARPIFLNTDGAAPSTANETEAARTDLLHRVESWASANLPNAREQYYYVQHHLALFDAGRENLLESPLPFDAAAQSYAELGEPQLNHRHVQMYVDRVHAIANPDSLAEATAASATIGHTIPVGADDHLRPPSTAQALPPLPSPTAIREIVAESYRRHIGAMRLAQETDIRNTSNVAGARFLADTGVGFLEAAASDPVSLNSPTPTDDRPRNRHQRCTPPSDGSPASDDPGNQEGAADSFPASPVSTETPPNETRLAPPDPAIDRITSATAEDTAQSLADTAVGFLIAAAAAPASMYSPQPSPAPDSPVARFLAGPHAPGRRARRAIPNSPNGRSTDAIADTPQPTPALSLNPGTPNLATPSTSETPPEDPDEVVARLRAGLDVDPDAVVASFLARLDLPSQRARRAGLNPPAGRFSDAIADTPPPCTAEAARVSADRLFLTRMGNGLVALANPDTPTPERNAIANWLDENIFLRQQEALRSRPQLLAPDSEGQPGQLTIFVTASTEESTSTATRSCEYGIVPTDGCGRGPTILPRTGQHRDTSQHSVLEAWTMCKEGRSQPRTPSDSHRRFSSPNTSHTRNARRRIRNTPRTEQDRENNA